jgi:hypothetical protein
MWVNGSKAVTTVGESALTGWRGKVGGAVARPIAERTRFSEQQVRAWIGLALLAYLLYRLLRPTIRAVRTAD